MVINVGKINSVYFRSEKPEVKQTNTSSSNDKVKELGYVTPDFGVKTPQKYTNLGVQELSNGLKIYSYKLANGQKVTLIPMEDSPTTVKNYVNVGSMNETDDIKGISHFLEHMAFNGTNGTDGYMKLERGDSFNKIDEMGGWTNASTSYALTDYVNSTQQFGDDDLEKQIAIIASMADDLALLPEMIEKEKNPVSSEIDMILDSADTIAIDQTVRTLFNVKSSADELVGGSVKHIKNLDRQKVLDYYNMYYTPDNMHLVITGNIDPDETIKLVSKYFHSSKKPIGQKYYEKLTPITKTVRKDFINDKTKSASITLGFATEPTKDVKSTIIRELVNRYISSEEFGLKEYLKLLNSHYSISTEKISTNPQTPTMTILSADCADNDTEKVLQLLFKKLSSLKAPDEEVINHIKKRMITGYYNMLENSGAINSIIGTGDFNSSSNYLTDYESVLNSITPEDINNYINKYLDLNKVAITVIHPETAATNITENNSQINSVNFTGNKQKPINPEKASIETLDNNCRLAFSESKNNNVPFIVSLNYKLPTDINPAALSILNGMFKRGTMTQSKADFSKFEEENNIAFVTSVCEDGLCIICNTGGESFEKSVDKAIELLYNPRLTQKEFDRTVKTLKAHLSRHDETAGDLYSEYVSKYDPYNYDFKTVQKGLDTVTLQDVKDLYNYILNNSSGTVTMNIPEKSPEFKEKARTAFSKLNDVKPYEYNLMDRYFKNDKTVVLTKPKNNSQAEIKEYFHYKTDNSIKDTATSAIMNYILSSSNSIGLFNNLREKEHLAYRVNSYADSTGNRGKVALHILTSTDNKATGEVSYKNLEKSINGFNTQIAKLLNSEYTDEDLETAKKVYKSELLQNETAYDKLSTLYSSLYYNQGVDYNNKIFDFIDSITREDIDNFAKRVFSQKPIYAITATEDTLKANQDFLQSLEN